MTEALLSPDSATTLIHFYFHPDSYQVLHVVNKQDAFDQISLNFTGAFGADLYESTASTDARVLEADLNLVQVYFATQEPTDSWSDPTNFELITSDAARTIPENFGDEMWVIIANPSTSVFGIEV